ncbi:hypothetical protein HS041_29860 [Planomonospora sp. ID67723]|uniref:hypothetical protein n=1 Tax=Planomonospora sp. ID67723 TaxID=2738134 RepID=UPI0018C4378A|nr:hypothetical protein [Planomonospora sp. ID67723]MBG0831919.1 hypothetical protein [Planomonospora sp. ID67723]
MSNFEERLLMALKEEITTGTAEERMAITTPVRRRSGRRVAGLAAALAGAAAATAVAVTLFSGAGSPAFAVTKGAGGSVDVWIKEFRDSAELEAKLAEEGITAQVDYLPGDQICEAPRDGRSGGGRAGEPVESKIGRDGRGIFFQLKPGQITTGETLVLRVSFDHAHPDQPPTATSLQVTEGEVEPCKAVPMPEPNGPGPAAPEPTGPATTEKSGTGEDEGPGLDSSGG